MSIPLAHNIRSASAPDVIMLLSCHPAFNMRHTKDVRRPLTPRFMMVSQVSQTETGPKLRHYDHDWTDVDHQLSRTWPC